MPTSVQDKSDMLTRGYVHRHLIPFTCPSDIHKSCNPVIPMQHPVIVNGDIPWEGGCMDQNVRHSISGGATTLTRTAEETSSMVIEGAKRLGFYRLPNGLTISTKCAITDNSILPDMTPSDIEKNENIRGMFEATPRYNEFSADDSGVRIPKEGISFFVACTNDVMTFIEDSEKAVKLAIDQLPAGRPDSRLTRLSPTDDPTSNVSNSCSRTVRPKFCQIGKTLELPKGLSSHPLTFFRLFQGWLRLSCGHDPEDLPEVVDLLKQNLASCDPNAYSKLPGAYVKNWLTGGKLLGFVKDYSRDPPDNGNDGSVACDWV